MDSDRFEDPHDVLKDIGESKLRSDNLKREIDVLSGMLLPIVQRKMDAKKFIDISISTGILKQLDKELE